MRNRAWAPLLLPWLVRRLISLAALWLLAMGIVALLSGPRPQALWSMEVHTARRYGLPPALVAAVVAVESGGDRYAVSSRGALGLMQATRDKFRPDEDPFDPATNLDVGARYLAEQMKRFHGDMRLALAAYNAGPAAVVRYRGVPPYPETRAYVRRVLRLYARWRHRGG